VQPVNVINTVRYHKTLSKWACYQSQPQTMHNWVVDIRQSWWSFLGSESCLTAYSYRRKVPHLHMSTQHPGTSLYVISFTWPSPR